MFEHKNQSNHSLRWLLALVLSASAVGCAVETNGTDEDVQTSELPQALTGSTALFLNTSTMFGSQFDWDLFHGKGECAPGDAVVGISRIPGGPGRNALCQASTSSLSPGSVVATLLYDGDNQRLASRNGDWSFGQIKFECGEGQYVSAVSQDVFGDTNFHGVQCAQGTNLGQNETCTAHVFDTGDSRGTTTTGDWDPWAYKGECGLGEYVVGVSMWPPSTPAQGSLHSILCCSTP